MFVPFNLLDHFILKTLSNDFFPVYDLKQDCVCSRMELEKKIRIDPCSIFSRASKSTCSYFWLLYDYIKFTGHKTCSGRTMKTRHIKWRRVRRTEMVEKWVKFK